MASLYKRRLKSGEVWYGKVKLRDGRWKNFCTNCPGRREAKEIVAAIEREIAAGRDPFGRTAQTTSMDNLISSFLSTRQSFWADKTQRAYKDALERLKRAWGDSVPSHVSDEAVECFRKSLGNISPASINHYLSHIAAFLHWCQEKGYVQSVIKIKRIRQPGQAQRDYYTLDECSALLTAADGREINGVSFRAFLVLLMTTGLRVGEATELRWEWIDKERRQIRLPPTITKSSRKRVVPMAPDLLQVLPPSEDRIFPFSGTSGHVGTVWKAVVKAACVRYLKLHNLRDTAAVQMILAGTPLPVVSRILGHASVTTTMSHYADLTGEEALAATEFATNLLRHSLNN